MKKDIHPELHEITARCMCGNAIRTHSTATELNATICAACHPFFTGEQKYVDSAGRIEKFDKKYKKNKA